MKGYIQVYTGNGKGKTTAALGLALRGAGAGLKTYIAQFMKGVHYSELEALKRFDDLITLRQFGRDSFVHEKPDKEDIDLAQKGCREARHALISGEYDIVILDEVSVAVYFRILSTEQLLSLIDDKPDHVELVITGRYAPEEVIVKADLVTEMRDVKHYYDQGVAARAGIES
jgi:cob(I)alamin adenosyltransferase